MKVLLFFPRNYSLDKTVREGFKYFNCDLKIFDFTDFFTKWQNYFIIKTGGMPQKIQRHWFVPYLKKINKCYLQVVKSEKPDLLIVYNDQYLLPDTAKEIKKICPIFNILGDNPLYIERRPFNVATLLEMNYVFAPDSFWVEQIKQIGFEKISTLYFGYSKDLHYPLEPNKHDLRKYGCDLLMIGRTYRSSWGYKRALFYNQFTDLDIKIYGRNWDIWFNYFPKLKDKVCPLDKPLSFETINLLCACSKIYPIDANPGLIYGLHTRIFDVIGSGILPLVEYRKDIDSVFKGVFMPVIKDYKNAKDIAKYYLKNEKERKEIVVNLRTYLDKNINPIQATAKILEIYGSI